MRVSLLIIFLLQSCSSSRSTSDINSPQVLEKKELPNCSEGRVLTDSEIQVFKGRTPQSPAGWNQIAKCYFHRGETGISELFYRKVLIKEPSNFRALNGLLETSMRNKNYSQSINYIKQLQRQYGNKIEIWEQSARLALSFYDLPMATTAVSKLKRFRDKKFYILYTSYLLALKDQKTQALSWWNKMNSEMFKGSPEAAFTGAYLGYLLDDKIKARKFLNTAGEDSNPELFDNISKLVE